MKIAIGYRLHDGPWGGGNRFVSALKSALEARGDTVVHSLDDRDIDIILLMDPRSRLPDFTFGAGAILRYLAFRNPDAVVIHRVNECDERKNTRLMNGRLARANYCADHTVFVGSWMLGLPVWQRTPPIRPAVILNGADTSVFNPQGFSPWRHEGPLRLVTHHWGGNWMKGFDIYQRLDVMLAEPKWKGRLHFTYIGNVPKGFQFINAAHVQALDGTELANEIRSHHGYLTASINEPGGNHQNEGALCGLPMLYRRSGCLPEYCDGFGVSFDERDFEGALEEYLDRYDEFVGKMPGYPHTADRACREYVSLFDEILSQREETVAARRIWRNLPLMLRNQIPL
jgi:hypothetical protein